LTAPGSIPLDYVPTSDADLKRYILNRIRRLCSGHLYLIRLKAPECVSEQTVVTFKPNAPHRLKVKPRLDRPGPIGGPAPAACLNRRTLGLIPQLGECQPLGRPPLPHLTFNRGVRRV
jgi:hypothetical protein